MPFWHAARINGLLDSPAVASYDVPGDPFFSSCLTDPLEWLADVATPDGTTPPLDDGNKQRMYNSGVLRWTGAYGKGIVGRKSAWINDQFGPGTRADMLLMELSIPRVAPDAGITPVASLGYTSASQTGESGEQQLVIPIMITATPLRSNIGGIL